MKSFASRSTLAVLFVIGLWNSPVAAQKSPQEELKSLKIADDMQASLFASEPMITNPAAIDVDTQGRVWVAEIQWYRKFSNQPPQDKIKVLEDTDGDGAADKVTVFAEGVYAPMSICVAGPKVFVATSPDLWLFEDNNGDLKADGPPKKILTGFGGFNHDHGAHSLVLGPDHKWWMSHGDAGFDVTGADGSRIQFNKGAMLRGELDMTRLEVVASNFRNPYEIAVNSFGEAFCSDNDNDGNRSVRICWILEGGNYGWYGRPGPKFPHGTPFADAWHFRGAVPGFVPSTIVTGFGSPCGMCYYEGDAFPRLKNMPLHCDAGPREVRAYPHQKNGAGYRGESVNFITCDDDPYFRPDDICAMPDGSLLVSDWYDGGVGGHAYNNPEQGRIFRLTPKGGAVKRIGKPGPYASVADAVEGLQSPNLATQFLAREKLLAEGQAAVPALVELMRSANKNYGARAMWLLDRIGGDARKEVVKLLHCEDPDFEALAFRILRRHTDDAELVSRLTKLCVGQSTTREIDREHLLFLAKVQGADAERLIGEIAARGGDGDRFFAESVNIAARGREQAVVKAMMGQGKQPGQMLDALTRLYREAAIAVLGTAAADGTNDIATRTAALDRLGVLLDEKAFQTMVAVAASKDILPDIRRRAVEWLLANCASTGLWSGLIGDADASVSAWIDYKPEKSFNGRSQLAAVARALLIDDNMIAAGLTLVEQARLNEASEDVLTLANSATTPLEIRRGAIRAAISLSAPGVAESLGELAASGDERIRKDVLEGLVDLQRWELLKQPLTEETGARIVVDRMMGSTGGALVLLKWLDQKSVSEPTQVYSLKLAAKHPDVNVRALFEKYIPESDRPQRLGSAVKAEDILKLAGDPRRGEQIYGRSSASQCKNCHVIRGQGKDMGPELTQIGKKYERGALLETILDPSKAISHGYETYLAETKDGQVFAGFLVQQNASVVVLRGADGKQVRINAKQLESLTKSEKSIMPELVLKDVTAQDAADLLAYLMTLK